ncbi:hypothetical protein PSEUDO8Z_60257 [Pseudomonas sp. 8Z]|nr:hypothetical protein PSEUDO8Z_60257 [Pseudomonas sp. 8Z]
MILSPGNRRHAVGSLIANSGDVLVACAWISYVCSVSLQLLGDNLCRVLIACSFLVFRAPGGREDHDARPSQ